MRHVWIAFKFLVSSVLGVVAIAIAFGASASGRWTDPMALASVALFLFLATLPWAYPFKKSPRAAGLVCIFLAILCAVLSYQVVFGGSELPKDCSSYHRKVGCHIINAIYELSGRAGVAGLWAVVAGLLLWGACKLIREAHRERA